jgi:membrane-bound lytic murein transglycosylase MltF
MGKYMTTQNYLMINQSTNVVDNICLWDGNPDTWQPPANNLMLVQATTPTLVWQLNDAKNDWVLVEEMGVGDIGFTWNPTTEVLTNNKPKPKPITRGTQML